MLMRLKYSGKIPYIYSNGTKYPVSIQPHTERVIRHLLQNWWRMEEYGSGPVGQDSDNLLFRSLGHELQWAMDETLSKQEIVLLLDHLNNGYSYEELVAMHGYKSRSIVGKKIKSSLLLLGWYLEKYAGWDKLQEDY